MVGERGSTLSGGQKARLGLARAVYQESDIVLLDDPLSALDSNVRKAIINELLFGMLKDKTRIMTTHALDFLEKADQIVLMKKGQIIAKGSFIELQEDVAFKELLNINQMNTEII